MDKKIEIKEGETLTDIVFSQNEREFFHKMVSVKIRIDDMLQYADSDMTIKTEIKSEIPFMEHVVKQINVETATSSNTDELGRKSEIEQETLFSDFGSQNEGEFLLCHPVMINKKYNSDHEIHNEMEIKEGPCLLDKKYNSDHEIHNKIEIKEEPCWLETDASSVQDDFKDRDFSPLKSAGLPSDAVSGTISDKSPVTSIEISERNTTFCNGSDHLEIGSTLCLKPKSLCHKGKRLHECDICGKHFKCLTEWKRHYLIHDVKPYQCKTCPKRFTRLLYLKNHCLIHEGKKPHQCNTCSKSFTLLSYLKRHYLVHESNRAYLCKMCNKSFIHLSSLKKHYLIHSGLKPHQCKICNKSFTELSTLKRHNLIHECKKPHQCKICHKSFTQLSTLNYHYLIHEGKKLHECKKCFKSFTQLSTFMKHSLIHEGKKAHQ